MNVTSKLKRFAYLSLQRWIEREMGKNRLQPDCALWGLGVNDKHHLTIGGHDCVELAAQYGTPLFVVDKQRLQNNYAMFRDCLASLSLRGEILYSYKTNPVPGILAALHTSGAGAEVISPYELWLALHLGVHPEAVVYNGPNKSEEGLRLAVRRAIKLINVNSFREIEILERLAAEEEARPAVGVRISTIAGWGAQFGFKLETGEAHEAFARLQAGRRLQAKAIHVHLGTNVSDPHTYRSALVMILRFIRELKDRFDITIQYLDMGGGYGVPTVRALGKQEARRNTFLYKPFQPPAPDQVPSISAFIQEIEQTFRGECRTLGLVEPVLLFEPGRAMTSNTEILLTAVGDFKETRNGFNIALLDAGINIAQPLQWEYHEILLANKTDARYDRRYGLAGPICTPSDLFLKSKRLPELQVGDLLSIMDAGAYFTSFANDFSFPRPAIVMVDEGRKQMIRERETFDDLIRKDVLS